MDKYIKNENLGKIVSVEIDNSNFGKVGEYKARIIGANPSNIGQVIAIYNDELIIVPKDKIMYEPEIKEQLGVLQSEKVLCFYEKTCGAVMYTEQGGERKYLLIKNDSGHIGFPKGHIELNETEEETAVREVFEETGFEITLNKNIRSQYQFITRENTQKNCVYFLAHYDYAPAKIQESEISQSWLVPYNEAILLLNFVQDQEILEKAEKILGQ